MALETLWMLELARQCGFRACTTHQVSAPGNPGAVSGDGILDCLGKNATSSEGPEPSPGTDPVPFSLNSNEIGGARGEGVPRKESSRHHDEGT